MAIDSLQPILKHAWQHSPFYSDVGSENLIDFPIINRSILQANIDRLLTAPAVTKRPLLDALQGRNILASHRTASEFRFSREIIIEQTSGSSGVPLRLPKTESERRQLSLAAWQCRRRRDPEVKLDEFLALFHRTLDTPLPVSPFGSSIASIKNFYQWLHSQGMRWIHAPPALIGYHASVLKTVGLYRPAPSLYFVETSGSKPDSAAISTIKEVIGASIINQFGTRESWTIGYADELAPFEINSSAVHVELLDHDNQIITDDRIEGDVTITSKILKLLPLIRYKTGDRGCWITTQDATGQTMKKLSLADERDINMIFYNGKWISGNILFKDIFHKIDHKIGYGYAKFMQVRKTGEHEFRLLVCQCEKVNDLHAELCSFLQARDPRVIIKLDIIPEEEGRTLAERKPYFFVNEHDLQNFRMDRAIQASSNADVRVAG